MGFHRGRSSCRSRPTWAIRCWCRDAAGSRFTGTGQRYQRPRSRLADDRRLQGAGDAFQGQRRQHPGRHIREKATASISQGLPKPPKSSPPMTRSKYLAGRHHPEDERRAITKAVPDAAEAYVAASWSVSSASSTSRTGNTASSPPSQRLPHSGCNFQRYCHANIFVGVRYQFEEFIQAIHRTRYGQERRSPGAYRPHRRRRRHHQRTPQEMGTA